MKKIHQPLRAAFIALLMAGCPSPRTHSIEPDAGASGSGGRGSGGTAGVAGTGGRAGTGGDVASGGANGSGGLGAGGGAGSGGSNNMGGAPGNGGGGSTGSAGVGGTAAGGMIGTGGSAAGGGGAAAGGAGGMAARGGGGGAQAGGAGGTAAGGGAGGASSVDQEGTIASGLRHTCLIRNGAIHCWGANDYGQLGLAGMSMALTPQPVPGIADAVSVATGNVHTCAVRKNRQVLCWGGSQDGDPRLGRGPTATIAVGPIPNFSADIVSGGFVSTCAISGGALTCWGENDYGVLGTNMTGPRDSPTPVANLSNVVSVSVGPTGHACAVVSPDRRAYCWGRNAFGALGDRSTTDSSVPVPVQNLSGAVKVAAGSFSTCALLLTGQVSCWGDNSAGQLGDGTVMPRLDPTTPAVSQVAAVRAGNGHWCVVQKSGQVACWGQNGAHQTGSAATGNVPAPFVLPGISDAVAVSLGSLFTCVLHGNGSVSCWGTNAVGQLGNGTMAPSTDPTPVLLP